MANMGFGVLLFGGFCIAVAYLPSDGFLSVPPDLIFFLIDRQASSESKSFNQLARTIAAVQK